MSVAHLSDITLAAVTVHDDMIDTLPGGSAVGAGSASGSGTLVAQGSGSAEGSGSASGSGQLGDANAELGSGSASGASSASGAGQLVEQGMGSADGTGDASGGGTLVAQGSGAAAGSGSASGSGTLVAPQVTTDPDASSIDSEGWRVTVANLAGTDPATDDVVPGDERYVVVQSAGFDAVGQPTTVTRNLAMTGRIDEIYPNHGTLTADQVALSETIYNTCVVPGLANNSVEAPPLPIGLWITKDRQRWGASVNCQLFVAHAQARNGRPAAAVKFIVSDVTGNSAELIVSATTQKSYQSGLSLDVYEGDVSTSALNQGEQITIDAVIYPWIGNAFRISTDADAYPSPNLSVLKGLCDKDGTYGEIFAYVSSTGNDGTGVTSTNSATAQATPFATIAAANIALKAANNTTFSRNNLSGCVCRLEVGDHEFDAPNPNGDDPADIAFIIEAANPANKATTGLTQPSGNNNNSQPLYIQIRSLTAKKGPNNVRIMQNDQASTYEPFIIWDDVTFDLNGNPAQASYNWDTGRNYFFECNGDDIGQSSDFGSLLFPAAIGCTGDWLMIETIYNHAANRSVTDRQFGGPPPADQPTPKGRMFANSFFTSSNAGTMFRQTDAIDAFGLAIVNVIFETTRANFGNPVVSINADGNTEPVQNLIEQFVSLPGNDRRNGLYQDAGTAPIRKKGYMRGCLFYNNNVKGDFFGESAQHTGNQSEMHRVDHHYNCAITGSEGGQGPSRSFTFSGDILGLGNVLGNDPPAVVMDFADDQTSVTGGGAGGGDYTPGPAYAGPIMPAGYAAYGHDLFGTPVPDDGTAVAGAVQRSA